MSEALVSLSLADFTRLQDISNRIPGWSQQLHYAFFKYALEQIRPTRILVLGVYHGRDIAFLVDLIKQYHPERQIEIVGVDRFTADPCADWAQGEKEIRTWEQETSGLPPPSFEKATANTADPRVKIIRSDDFTFLDTTQEKFDLVYVDTSHDFNTVIRQLRQIPRICLGDALICGDDYSDRDTWGVKSAVSKAFHDHSVFEGWIWFSKLSNLKQSAPATP